MKKIYNVMMLAAVAAAALVSCAKEMDKPEVAPEGEGIKVSLQADAVTKTYIEGVTPKWKATDAVGVFTGSDATNKKFTNTKADGEAAVFEGTVDAAGTYYAYYPYSTGGASNLGALVEMPHTQYPTPTSFDGAADLLVSEAIDVTASGDQSLNVKFRRLGAFLKFIFIDGTTGGRLSGEHATEVQLIVNHYVDGDYRPCPSVRITPDGLGTIGDGMKTIKAVYDEGVYALTADGNAAWFGVRPNTFAAGNTFELTITAEHYTISKTLTLPNAVELGAGQILPIQVTLTDEDAPAKKTKIVKLWEKLSTAETNWFAAVGGAAGADFNIAIDDQNVYIPAFGGSKKLIAIDIATGNTVKEVNTTTVQSTGFDGSIYLSCARVVKKNDGTPVLMATNLFQDATNDATGRLYIWDNGVDQAPRVATLQQWSAGRRLGDTWTTYGDYEDCWLIMGTQTGNGFVTFKVPTGSTSYLISRLAIDTGDFCSYYPFPGDLLHGMFTWRGGNHDDGLAYRNRLMTISSTEEAIKTSGAHTSELSILGTWMDSYENNNGSGFNYIEFNGKRYVIWVINMADSKTFDIVVKEGSTTTPWNTIIDTKAADITAAGGFAFRESLVGGQDTTWKQGTDCAVWNNGDEVYIAVNKVNVGLAVYKMYCE